MHTDRAVQRTAEETVEQADGGARLRRQQGMLSLNATAWVALASALFGLAVWHFVFSVLVQPLLWPPLTQTVTTAIANGPQLITVHALASAYRAVAGFALGCFLGVVVGLIMVWNRWIAAFITPYIAMLRPIPAIALIPFFIIWFGVGDLGKIYMIAFGCFIVMVVTTIEGVKSVSPIYRMAARVLGADELALYRTVILPGALPALMGGLRVCATLSFGMVFVAEFMGASTGVGYLIIWARQTLNTDQMLLGVILIGLLAFLFDQIIARIGHRVTNWMPR